MRDGHEVITVTPLTGHAPFNGKATQIRFNGVVER